jgi:hypothetical protein
MPSGGDLDPGRREHASQPSVVGEQRGEGDAGDRRRQGERDVDDGVEQPPQGEIVAHQHPHRERSEHEIDERRQQRDAEAQFQRIERAVAGDDGDELGRAELRGLEKQGAERNENDDGKPGQGQAECDPKARDYARPTPPHTTGRGKCSLAPHFAQ